MTPSQLVTAALVGLLASGCVAPDEDDTYREGFALVWSDEFDETERMAPNEDNWVYDIGGHGWGKQSTRV